MPRPSRVAKTFSVDRDLLQLIEQTRGEVSSSQRINELLKAGLEAERRHSLEREAAEFFDSQGRQGDDRAERSAFQSASIKSLSRE